MIDSSIMLSEGKIAGGTVLTPVLESSGLLAVDPMLLMHPACGKEGTVGELNTDDYKGLVSKLAYQQYTKLHAAGVRHLTLEDLQRAGDAGMAVARQRYDPSRGIRFGTFAFPFIYGAIRDYLRRLDPLTPRQRKQVRALAAATVRCQDILGREPTTEEVAHVLGITVDDVRQIAALRVTFLALDTPVRTNDEGQDQILGDTLIDDSPTPELIAMRRALTQDMDVCLAKALTEEERRVVMLRFEANLTLQEIGRMLGIPSPEAAASWTQIFI